VSEDELLRDVEQQARHDIGLILKEYEERIEKLVGVAEFADSYIEKFKGFAVAPNKTATYADLESMRQILSFIAIIQHRTLICMRDLQTQVKEAMSLGVVMPAAMLLKASPEMGKAIGEKMQQRVGPLEQEIKKLNEKKDIELQVPQNIQKALQEWFAAQERAKKAQEEYTR